MAIRANPDQRICYYPLCTQQAMWTPLVKIPTVRTGGNGKLVKTDRPTMLVFNNICNSHKETYNLAYWIKPQDWIDIGEEARRRGFNIPELSLVHVEFIPLGDGLMHSGYLEMDRK